MSDLAELSATELVSLFRAGAATPVEAVSACLERSSADAATTNAVITSCYEPALDAAEVATRRYRDGSAGPLEGVPFGVKDTIATKGVRTTGGSSIYGDWIPHDDAALIERIQHAGGIVVAKHSAFSFALGDESRGDFGATRNPWDLDRTPGGSSSGSGAAVAARQVPVSIGSDTGGSIRLPATWCGVSGIKPTYGRVPVHGVMPLAWSLDTAGPLARTVEDLASFLQVMAGHDDRDSTSSRRPVGDYTGALRQGVAGLKIGVPQNWFLEICDPHIASAVERAAEIFAAEGAHIVPITLPNAHLTQAIGWFIILAELGSLHEGNLERLDEYDPGFSGHLVNSQFVTAQDYMRCLRLRSVIQADYETAFSEVDAILVPGNPSYAPKLDNMMCQVGDREYFWLEIAARTTFSANITGIPALSVPAGLGWNDLPLGIGILARPFDEETCFRVGHTYQQLTDHHRLAPPLAVA